MTGPARHSDVTGPARPLPEHATIVIVTYNGAHLLADCLDSVTGEGAARIIVVDNASVDETTALLAQRFPQVHVVASNTNTGFAGGVALALPLVRTPFVVLLNNDATVAQGWLARLLEPLADAQVGAVSSKLVLPDGRLNSAGGYLEPNGYGHDLGFGEPDDGRWDEPAEIAYACGAAAAYRVAAVRGVGGVDPRFFLYYEDVDLSWRLWLSGWRVRYQPSAVVVHQHSATTSTRSMLHTFSTERNRLACLITCATPGLVVRTLARYPLTTLSVAVGESRPKAWARVRALASLVGWLPGLLRRRRATETPAGRRAVQSRLLVGAKPLPPAVR
ncbi:glycosyltransferase family 2 protein [Jatrophihabitans telluris]|uniref:Glycosyltransferase family 2 protein n=1 Tax=Jatrophihabitans telluris TaxID=2038343 RepID=A0ABY4QV72_9ACTN|nr:glycosyltransferase family 2 protein [Jatrophihabitans telluris]UQX87558.1 glycosyltransferase family 2 protein [Jatrophihabitans telluris]